MTIVYGCAECHDYTLPSLLMPNQLLRLFCKFMLNRYRFFTDYELSECLPYIIFQVQSLHKFLKLFIKNDDGWSLFNGSVKKVYFYDM